MNEFDSKELDELRRFSVTERQPVLRALRLAVSNRRLPATIVAPVFVVAAAFVIYVAAAALAFWKASIGPSSVAADVEQALRGRTTPAHGVPLDRDYGFMLLTLWTILSYANCARQWTRLERLPELTARTGLLRTDVHPTDFFRGEFARLSTRCCKRRWETLSAALALLLAVVTAWAVITAGVYPLSDAATDDIPRQVALFHYRTWWANPDADGPGFAIVMAIVWSYGYITIRHTILGAHVLIWLGEVRHRTRGRGTSGWFGYSDRWSTPEDGLAEVRGALLDVFTSVLLGAFALGTAVYLFNFPPLLIALFVVYLCFNISVFVVPWAYMNRQLVRSKRELRAAVLSDLRQFDADEQPRHSWDLEQLAYARVADFPDHVLAKFPVGALVALYLIPVIGIIPAYR